MGWTDGFKGSACKCLETCMDAAKTWWLLWDILIVALGSGGGAFDVGTIWGNLSGGGGQGFWDVAGMILTRKRFNIRVE